jgi:hypothetical protein
MFEQQLSSAGCNARVSFATIYHASFSNNGRIAPLQELQSTMRRNTGATIQRGKNQT